MSLTKEIFTISASNLVRFILLAPLVWSMSGRVFATFLVKHSTLKVYLALCIPCISTWAFLMLLLIACNCSEYLEELQELKVILLVTISSFMDDLMVIIFRALDTSPPHHCMIWEACHLEFFGFLSPELMVPKLESFSLAIHLGVADI